jgi:catechol 2,3-dioxygenase-like lactoylglutathione lyase family enzyme
MKLEHCALTCFSAEEADRFFSGLLGLNKLRAFTIPGGLANDIFGESSDRDVVRYGNQDFDVEVFLLGKTSKEKLTFSHLCLQVEDREAFYEKAQQMNVEAKKIPRPDGNGYHLFVRDPTGNLYEIK